MRLIAGLGNPGARYKRTYHNLGFEVVDEVARRHHVEFESAPADALIARVRGVGEGVLLAKPLTFMNLSGPAVAELLRYYRIEIADLLVVVDDVNLPVARLRARRSGSAGGHKGLKSIIAALGSDSFARLRVGVGRGDERRDLVSHVIGKIPEDDWAVVKGAVTRAAAAVEMFVDEGIEVVMNRFNAEEQDEADGGQNTS